MGEKMLDETQAKLQLLFLGGLNSHVPVTIFSEDKIYPNLSIKRGFEKIRVEDSILLEIIFRVEGSASAYFHWVAKGEKKQMDSSGTLPVDSIEFGGLSWDFVM